MPKQLSHKTSATTALAAFEDDRMEPFAHPQPILDQREKEDMLSMFNYFGWEDPVTESNNSKRKAHDRSPSVPTSVAPAAAGKQHTSDI
ncbi:hypothetical protein BASA81_002173 [Batrachochytrium salamandrivorans]|nr:hypothetical protein BASA81_002173 [Batrachochytrium salamandrivorans]